MFSRICAIVSVAALVVAQPAHKRGLPIVGGLLGGGADAAAAVTVTVGGGCPTYTHTVTVTETGTWGVPTSTATSSSEAHWTTSTSKTEDHTSKTSTSTATWTSKTEDPITKTSTTTKGGETTSTWTTTKGGETTSKGEPSSTWTSHPTEPTDPGHGQCSSGSVKCCKEVKKAKDVTGVAGNVLSGLLGVVLNVEDLVGISCSPISVIGIGGNSCASQTACCSGGTYNGLVTVACSPINVDL